MSAAASALPKKRRYRCRIDQIRVERETLADMLRSHGEDDLAERALSLAGAELTRIRQVGAYYAFSKPALSMGGSMGGARALSLATIDVVEGTQRDLRWARTQGELKFGWSAQLSDDERERDRVLRSYAAEHHELPGTPDDRF